MGREGGREGGRGGYFDIFADLDGAHFGGENVQDGMVSVCRCNVDWVSDAIVIN